MTTAEATIPAGADASPPAAPQDAPPAPLSLLSTDPAAPPKKKRGRPPGSGDTRPRKPRAPRPPGAASNPVAQKPVKDETPGLFDQSPGVASAATVPPAKIDLAATIDPAVLAQTALSVGSEVVCVAASMRYPKHIVDQAIRFQPSEIETLQPLLTEWIKSSTTQIDPGTAFLIFAGLMLGTHVLIAERMRAAEMPPPAPPVPPPSAASVPV